MSQDLPKLVQAGAAMEQGGDSLNQGGLRRQLELFPGYKPLPIQGKTAQEKDEGIPDYRAICRILLRHEITNIEMAGQKRRAGFGERAFMVHILNVLGVFGFLFKDIVYRTIVQHFQWVTVLFKNLTFS